MSVGLLVCKIRLPEEGKGGGRLKRKIFLRAAKRQNQTFAVSCHKIDIIKIAIFPATSRGGMAFLDVRVGIPPPVAYLWLGLALWLFWGGGLLEQKSNKSDPQSTVYLGKTPRWITLEVTLEMAGGQN